MSKEYSRRTFLKTAGAAAMVLALTACGGGGGSYTPIPSQPTNYTNMGTLDVKLSGKGMAQSHGIIYLSLMLGFTDKAGKSHVLIANDQSGSNFTLDAPSGVVMGFLKGRDTSTHKPICEEAINVPEGGGVTANLMIMLTSQDLEKSSFHITLKYNGKKIVYTAVKTTNYMGVTDYVIRTSEVTNA